MEVCIRNYRLQTNCKSLNGFSLQWNSLQILCQKIIENQNSFNSKFIYKITKSITLKKLNNNNLYNPEITTLSSLIAKRPFVRKALKNFQLNLIKNSRLVVVEGRDIGSKIMPDADLKIFFTCSIKKAKRRLKEFRLMNKNISLKKSKSLN